MLLYVGYDVYIVLYIHYLLEQEAMVFVDIQGVFMDLSKAFDSVKRDNILLTKL